MGGAAFERATSVGRSTLVMPRMSHDVYVRLRDLYTQKIKDYFSEHLVTSLIEAPEKTDHGDVDLIVASDEPLDLLSMARSLGATAIIQHSSRKCSLAVPLDGSVSSTLLAVYQINLEKGSAVQPGTVSHEGHDETQAQIDVDLISPKIIEWYRFYSSYGDMTSILGYIVHHLGFVVRDVGFFMRLKELDDAKKSPSCLNISDAQGRLLLSTDPSQVMGFLNLSVDQYNRGFTTVEEYYQWLSKCRLISTNAYRIRRENSNSRRRAQKREIFSNFFDEWLPAHSLSHHDPSMEDEGVGVVSLRPRVEQARHDLVSEALTYFDKTDHHESMRNAIIQQMGNAHAARLLGQIISRESGCGANKLSELVRAFRRFTGVGDDGLPYMRAAPVADADAELYLLLEDDGEYEDADHDSALGRLRHTAHLETWVREVWEVFKERERARERSAQRLTTV